MRSSQGQDQRYRVKCANLTSSCTKTKASLYFVVRILLYAPYDLRLFFAKAREIKHEKACESILYKVRASLESVLNFKDIAI